MCIVEGSRSPARSPCFPLFTLPVFVHDAKSRSFPARDRLPMRIPQMPLSESTHIESKKIRQRRPMSSKPTVQLRNRYAEINKTLGNIRSHADRLAQVQKLFRWISSLQMVRVNYIDEKTVNSVDVRRNLRIRRLYLSMKRNSPVGINCRSCWLSLSTTAPWSNIPSTSARRKAAAPPIFRKVPSPLATGAAISASTATTHAATRIEPAVASRSGSAFFHIDLFPTD